MVRPDLPEPLRVLDQSLHPEEAQSKQRIIREPLLRDARISTRGAEIGPDSQIERMLDQVLEQVLLATSATAAAVALSEGRQEEGMVCRASVGPNAPDVGVRLDVSSGLSGACVRTREVQYCADTEGDSRVNAAASRRLQVRSVLVVPVIEDQQLLGVFEIFSPHPGAFGNRDLQNLQTLTCVIVENLQELRRLQAPEPQPPEASVAGKAPEEQADPVENPAQASTEAISQNLKDTLDEPLFSFGPSQKSGNILEPPKAANAPPPGWPVIGQPDTDGIQIKDSPKEPLPKNAQKNKDREWGSSVLTGAVITLAVVLGWMVGRPSWQKVTSKSSQSHAVLTPAPEGNSSRSGEFSKNPDSEGVLPAEDAAQPRSAPRSRNEATPGGLVIYQNGKAIFRQTPPVGPSGSASASFRAAEPDPTEKVAAVFLSPQMASSRLIQRIEPVYPDAALQMHIQGEVELEALVGKDGSIEQLKLVSGDSLLAQAAADAVRQWKFRPYQSDGQFVEFSTRMSVDFRLP
jgi:TonB family protein